MTTPNLEAAIAAARQLRQDQQEALAQEIMERVAEFDEARLTAEQSAIVKERLQAPPQYASADDVRHFFASHGVE